jgi:hypothetical protein
MENYVNKKFPLANTWQRGIINDHIEVSVTLGSDNDAILFENPTLRRYCVFIYKSFNIAEGPKLEYDKDSKRRWTEIKCLEDLQFLQLPEALTRAEVIGQKEGLAVLLGREMPAVSSEIVREVIWHPQTWEPIQG